MTKRSVEEDATSQGIEFLTSIRGRYIIAQALYYGVKALESVEPEVYQEKSNIEDMKFLQETVFTFPSFVFDHQEPPIETVPLPV